MQTQNTLTCLAAQTTTQWVTLDQKSSQATLSMFETSKKSEKPLQECQCASFLQELDPKNAFSYEVLQEFF